MILCITEGARYKVIRMPDDDETIPVLNTHIRVRYEGRKYSFQAQDPVEFHTSRNPEEENRILLNQKGSDAIAEIDTAFDDEQYDSFERYDLKVSMSFGSGSEDAFCLKDPDIPPAKILFDPVNNRMQINPEGAPCAVNRKVVSGNVFWKPGDHLQILNLQMVFGYGFLAISKAANFISRDPQFLPSMKRLEEPRGLTVIHRNFQNPRLSLTYEAALDEPDEIKTKTDRPLVFLMGPALTMSSAALAGGIWSGYNSWMSGKELAEVLPLVLMPGIMVFSTILWTPLQRWYEKKQIRMSNRARNREYRASLKTIENDIQTFKDDYAAECLLSFPSAMKSLSTPGLLWQKTPERSDWMYGALGMGTQTFHLHLRADFHLKRTDTLKSETEKMIQRQRLRADTLLVFPMKENPRILYQGSQEYLRHFILDLCTQYGPDQLRFVVLAEQDYFEANPWLRMIPQCISADGTRTLASTEAEAREVQLCLEKEQPSQIILYSRIALLTPMFESLNPIILYDQDDGSRRNLELHFDKEHMEGSIQSISFFRSFSASGISQDEPYLFFKNLNHCVLEKDAVNVNRNPTFFDSYGVSNGDEMPLHSNWMKNHNSRRLSMPLGFSDRGELIELDLDEKGHGPHGLIAGTTGSGKSELIITLVLGLAANYSPRDVQFVMIDFKGGGAVSIFSNENYEIPHMAGVLSNLQPSGMERALVSFKNECMRREMLFQKMGAFLKHPVSNLYDYKQVWSEKSGLPELANLVIIVDEFAELKKEEPEFMKELISIARVGRSLGIHMILATQKPSGVVDDQIWANTHFKICMKVSSKQDSTEMIHAPDASYIHRPGEYYMLCDDLLTHAYSPYASGKEGVKKEASLITLTNGKLKSAAIVNNAMTQSYHTVMNILKLSSRMPSSTVRLWLPMLTRQSIRNMQRGCFGQLDDYQNKTQPMLSLNGPGMQHIAVFTNNRKEKLQFLNTLLYASLSACNDADEIYLVNDARLDCREICHYLHLCEIMESEDEEKIRLLNERAMDEKRTAMMTIIITDLSHFLGASDACKSMFHWWIEKGEQHHLHVYFMASNANAVPYKDLSLVPLRIALHNENPQDLSAIFEKPIKHPVRDPYCGKISLKGIHDIIYAETTENDLNALCSPYEGKAKVHSFPYIPEHLESTQCLLEGIPIGMDCSSYEWIMKPNDRNLVVMAMYEEELDELKEVYQAMKLPVLFMPDERESDDWNENGIVLLTSRMYQEYRLKNRPEMSDVLFVGSGLGEQSFFYPKDRRPLKKHTGVYISRGRQRRVHYVQS